MQHLEFARECVTNFNHAYGKHLVYPQTLARKSQSHMDLRMLSVSYSNGR